MGKAISTLIILVLVVLGLYLIFNNGDEVELNNGEIATTTNATSTNATTTNATSTGATTTNATTTDE